MNNSVSIVFHLDCHFFFLEDYSCNGSICRCVPLCFNNAVRSVAEICFHQLASLLKYVLLDSLAFVWFYWFVLHFLWSNCTTLCVEDLLLHKLKTINIECDHVLLILCLLVECFHVCGTLCFWSASITCDVSK